MSVNLSIDLRLVPQVTLSNASLSSGGNVVLHKGLNGDTVQLNATSTPPVTKYSEQAAVALAAGTKDIDLTNLPTAEDSADTFAGLKVQAVRIRNNSAATTLVVTPGASNGYQLNSTDGLRIAPGQQLLLTYKDNLADVDGTHKVLTFTGTGTETFDLALAAG